eukprot:Nitzschia sp. Nitz4//scaffold87_size112219//3911//5467//NITZ4_004056-RA/size112219-processed-gene-0.0-mRNA-1//1//CDS//3329559315//7785//frame0
MLQMHYQLEIHETLGSGMKSKGSFQGMSIDAPPKQPTQLRSNSAKEMCDTNSLITLQERDLPFYNYSLNGSEDLPPWVVKYVQWHSQVRQEFPGMELFTNPNAPKVLIRTCLGLCGGLHDRIGQLPWDLYLAHATNRVLLMAWQRPRSLENFLVPNAIHRLDALSPPSSLFLDWRVPIEAHFGFGDMHAVRNQTSLFAGYDDAAPTPEFWEKHVDAALDRARTGEFKHIKILRHRILGHLGETYLEERLEREFPNSIRTPSCSERQKSARAPVTSWNQVHSAPLFGNIFRLFFRPSFEVETVVDGIRESLGLMPHQYNVVHCRVRHPKATDYGVMVAGKNPSYTADKTGLPWEGETRQFALNIAAKALGCSLALNHTAISTSIAPAIVPVYFMSDSNDLVRHVSVELQDPIFVQVNRTEVDQALFSIVKPISSTTWVKARDVSQETAHIDKQKGRPPEAYYDTFVDLLLAMEAKCVVYGVGYYAVFAAKVSGIDCQYIYQKESWGHQAMKQASICPNL